MKDQIQINSVVQINENASDVMWIGCFAQVDEVKSWGIQAWINIPSERGQMPGRAFIRLNWSDFDYIGQAVLVPDETSN